MGRAGSEALLVLLAGLHKCRLGFFVVVCLLEMDIYECGILEAASRPGKGALLQGAGEVPARGPPGAPPGRGPLPRRPPARRMQHTAAFMGPADSAPPG